MKLHSAVQAERNPKSRRPAFKKDGKSPSFFLDAAPVRWYALNTGSMHSAPAPYAAIPCTARQTAEAGHPKPGVCSLYVCASAHPHAHAAETHRPCSGTNLRPQTPSQRKGIRNLYAYRSQGDEMDGGNTKI